MRNFCPKVVTLSTGFLVKGTINNQLGASFQQVSEAFGLPAAPIRHREVDLFGRVDGDRNSVNENSAEKSLS